MTTPNPILDIPSDFPRALDHDVQRSLGRIEGKLDLMLARIDHLDKTAGKHDERIDALEHLRTRLLAYASVASIFITAAWQILSNNFGKYFG